jgi:hypothetical protein
VPGSDLSPVPPALPPVSGSAYQPERTLAPIPPQQLPAPPPPPVRLEHLASFSGR